jgi:hypothetical protein
VNHYWFEALLPPYGWVPFDLAMSWGLALGDLARTEWSRYFFGRIDYRMRVEHFPSALLFRSGIRLPAAWYLVDRPLGRPLDRPLDRPLGHGVETGLFACEGRQLVVRDHLAVQWHPVAPGAAA